MENEFDFIKTFCEPLSKQYSGAFSLKDDCAFISGDFVVSTDTVIADIHFFEDDDPHLIAQKALRVNLSDIAAMGAKPKFYTLALSIPSNKNSFYNKEWMERFFLGLKTDQEKFNVALIGGDTTATPSSFTITITIFGSVEKQKMLRRNNAQNGDLIFVSDKIGDATLGLQILKDKKRKKENKYTATEKELISAYHLPTPFVELGEKLINIANSAIDVSDGFVADLTHLCKESNVGANIYIDKCPFSKHAEKYLSKNKISLENLITGGDDYILLMTVPPKYSNHAKEQAENIGHKIVEVGYIDYTKTINIFNNGHKMNFNKLGYQHYW